MKKPVESERGTCMRALCPPSGGEGRGTTERKESNSFGKTEAVDLAAPLM